MADRIQDLIFSFAFADAAGRERASAELAGFGQEAIPRLIAALEHPDDAVRGHAALTLGYIRVTDAAVPLARLVNDTQVSSRVRGLAMRALADVAQPRVAEALFDTAAKRRQDPDLFVRALACTLLGKLGDARGKPLLEASLKDTETWVREAAHKALAELRALVPAHPTPPNDTMPPATVLASAVVRTGMTPTARPQGAAPMVSADPVQAVVSRLKARDQPTRDQALGELVQIGSRAVPALLEALYDSHAPTSAACAQALGRIGDRRGLRGLCDLLTDVGTNDTLRAVALHAIGSLLEMPASGTPMPPPPELGPTLLEHVARPDRFVRAAAIAALGRVGGGAARSAICQALDDPEAWVREAAAAAAARAFSIDDSVALPRVIEVLSTALEPRLQAKLLRAMSRITARASFSDRIAIGPASHFLTSPDAGVRAEALEVIGRFMVALPSGQSGPDPHVVEQIVAALADPEPVIRRRALALCAERLPVGHGAATQVVLGQLNRGDPEATRLVALTLARIGNEEAIDALLELTQDPDGLTARAARQAALRIPADAPVQIRQDADGTLHKSLTYRCRCGGALAYVSTPQGREELRCPSCGTDHVVAPTGRLMTLAEAALGTCACTTCTRRSMLLQGSDEWAAYLVCPRTRILHVRPFDRPTEIRRLDQLELGACRCCPQAQPLEREAVTEGGAPSEQVVCHRTRRGYAFVDGQWLPSGSMATNDVAAINRALIGGSMALTTSGLPVDDDPAGGR